MAVSKIIKTLTIRCFQYAAYWIECCQLKICLICLIWVQLIKAKRSTNFAKKIKVKIGFAKLRENSNKKDQEKLWICQTEGEGGSENCVWESENKKQNSQAHW